MNEIEKIISDIKELEKILKKDEGCEYCAEDDKVKEVLKDE